MTEYGVRLGSAIMTVVDPWRGHEVEFNRWYERDHLYGGASLGPSVFSAARFLARARDKELRVAGDCDADTGTMLSLYWLVGDGSDYWRWSAENVKRLAAEGRMSAKGEVRTAQFLEHPWAEQRDADGVPAELALDRRFPGLFVTIVAAEQPCPPEEFFYWYRTSCARPLVAEQGLAELVLGFSARSIGNLARSSVEADGDEPRSRWLIGLWFVDRDPCDDGASLLVEHEKAMRQAGYGRTIWASPFIGTVPGTDRYLDQVWLA